MEIRKISIGADYKSSAMHYIVNQVVLGGSYHIHLIKHDLDSNSIKIWVENSDQEIYLKDIYGKNLTLICLFLLNII